MGKCVKRIALSVIAAVFGVLALSGPVFADPNTPNTEPDPIIIDDNPTDTIPITDDPDADEIPIDGDGEEVQTSTTCYDQVGSLGWIICPGAGLFGTIIDGAYNLLSNLIKINPLPTEQDSPIYVVWDYFKNITNAIFVIFFLVVIFSQLTGVGINNYGIKKILPRIIITAILVNISYIVCALAVDVSNILGNNFYGFFENIQNYAIQHGTISSTINGASVSAIVAAILGTGAIGAAGLALVAGVEGVIWFLLPILLSGVIAIASAVITMAARQALIFLLVIISPLAFVAYMLPNTEKWFSKWYHTLFQMIIFYPMFAVLYGASQLAGLLIISSSTNMLMVVLGIAVKVLPLFLSIPLMRMSGTVLGKIDGIIHRATAPVQGGFGRYAASHAAKAKERQLSKQNPILPTTRLAQYLDKRRAKRELDTAEMADFNKLNNIAYAEKGWYNRDGTLSKRGIRHNEYLQRRMDIANTRMNIESDFDEGFDENNQKRVRAKDQARVKRINKGFQDAIVDETAAQSRRRSVILNNMESKAKRIHDDAERSGSVIQKQILDSFHINNQEYNEITKHKEEYEAAAEKVAKNKPLTAAERAAYNRGDLTAAEKSIYDTGRKALNITLSDAITTKRKVDNETRSNYFELYDDTPAGNIPGMKLTEAISNKDYNSMNAAISVMAKRGDHNQIIEILSKHSNELVGDENIRFQKEINDACLGLKAEDGILWSWAKANMIRRAKHDGGQNLEAFIDLNTFINGGVMAGDGMLLNPTTPAEAAAAKDTLNMITMESILGNVRDGKIFAGTDRTVFNQFVKGAANGEISTDHYLFTQLKHLRASACSGQMDGEQLAAFNNYLTYGFGTKHQQDLFDKHQDEVKKVLIAYFRDMNTSQLASTKTATFEKFNDALIALDSSYVTTINGKQVSRHIYDNLASEIDALNRDNMSHVRGSMNLSVRNALGIKMN